MLTLHECIKGAPALRRRSYLPLPWRQFLALGPARWRLHLHRAERPPLLPVEEGPVSPLNRIRVMLCHVTLSNGRAPGHCFRLRLGEQTKLDTTTTCVKKETACMICHSVTLLMPGKHIYIYIYICLYIYIHISIQIYISAVISEERSYIDR